MAAPPYLTFRPTRRSLGPAWLTSNGESGLVGYVVDLIKDAFVERLREGLIARFPLTGPAGAQVPPADDALAAQGRDRRIVRGFAETSPAYAARLVRAIDDWKQAGTAFALMQKLAEYTGPLPSWRTVDVHGNWYSRAANGAQTVLLNQANWDWDGAPDALVRWSRFWVICYPNGLWTQGNVWGAAGTKWGDGRTWGTGASATSDQIAAMRAIVSDWKPGGTTCVNIILAFDPTSFAPTTARDGSGLPDGHWGASSKIVGGVRVASRPSTALFCAGV